MKKLGLNNIYRILNTDLKDLINLNSKSAVQILEKEIIVLKFQKEIMIATSKFNEVCQQLETRHNEENSNLIIAFQRIEDKVLILEQELSQFEEGNNFQNKKSEKKVQSAEISFDIFNKINHWILNCECPEKVIDEIINNMGENLAELRQLYSSVIRGQEHIEQQYNKTISEINLWSQRSKLALMKGDEELANQALIRKNQASNTAEILKKHLATQIELSQIIEKKLSETEKTISELKMKIQMLKTRYKGIEAILNFKKTLSKKEVQSHLESITKEEYKAYKKAQKKEPKIASAEPAFDRMIEKVLIQENLDQLLEKLIVNLVNLKQEFKNHNSFSVSFYVFPKEQGGSEIVNLSLIPDYLEMGLKELNLLKIKKKKQETNLTEHLNLLKMYLDKTMIILSKLVEIKEELRVFKINLEKYINLCSKLKHNL